MGGFFLPLSGGIDSSSTACIVASMCRQVCASVAKGDEQTLSDVRRVTRDPAYTPEGLCSSSFFIGAVKHVLKKCYNMNTSSLRTT